MVKQFVKLTDLMQNTSPVEIAPGKYINVRAISLNKMVELFMSQTENFLSLYSAGVEGKVGPSELAPFLLACPNLIAQIIAFATDEPDQVEAVEKYMPATVQLIALGEIWKLSVPDSKKAEELLSVVTALLQKVLKKNQEPQSNKLSNSSPKEY